MPLAKEYIEVTTAIGCPCNCLKYCPQDVLLKKYSGNSLFTLAQFKQAMASIPKNVEIVFSGFCEPFTNPQTVDLIEYAHNEGYQVSLFTTFFGATAEDIDRLATLPLNAFCLHLRDGEAMKTPLTLEYMQNVFEGIAKIQAQDSQIMFMKSGGFKTNNREDLVRGLVSKRHPVGFCPKLETPAFILLPNGDTQLCCIDFGLEHKTGNLLEEEYSTIRKRFSNAKSFSLCSGCSLSIMPTVQLCKYRSGKFIRRFLP